MARTSLGTIRVVEWATLNKVVFLFRLYCSAYTSLFVCVHWAFEPSQAVQFKFEDRHENKRFQKSMRWYLYLAVYLKHFYDC